MVTLIMGVEIGEEEDLKGSVKRGDEGGRRGGQNNFKSCNLAQRKRESDGI